ncbi:MBL fold metallo-hydrolase [Amycolatopsis cynarae]|uniref:MBL fold metallo-hydrolase n=1 Tax=Amycolatopsis cynarae TaxID=2995223 RepID=A0ABY7AZC2_9PSEU|nr:MBL fold metallo-hydrolase [Amycolatopsis sp. HUAS 11-8]WAL65037.1 MBL fold metallo-hydrolase [Amycolatopsis sp. HUAS 11-8]
MTRVTVLGSCGAWPEPGRACSGFLVTCNGFRLILDLGYGTASRLDGDVDAVIVTHEHPDHCVDVSALGRLRQYTEGAPKLPLYCPPGVLRVLEALEPRPHPATVFDPHDLAEPATVGPFRLESRLLPHHVPNYGVRLSAPGVTIAYTGDGGPSPELAELARDADLFIAEATLQDAPPDTEPRYLMTAGEAADWAARAGARRLLLTHFWPGSDREVPVRQARARFGGEVLAATEGLVLTL